MNDAQNVALLIQHLEPNAKYEVSNFLFHYYYTLLKILAILVDVWRRAESLISK